MQPQGFRRPLRFTASLLLAVAAGCDVARACTLIGCHSGLTVELNQPAPATYRIEVTSGPSLGATYVYDCPGGAFCASGSVMFEDYFPTTVTVKVITPGGTTTKTFNPTYTESFPNGKGCGPACRNGRVTAEVPAG